MNDFIDVKIDKQNLDRAIRIIPQALKFELGDAFDHIGRSFLSTFRKERLQGPPGVYGDGQYGLYGTFRRASLVSKTIEGMGLEIFSESKVSKRHEFGERVLPAEQALAVPIRAFSFNQAEMYTAGHRLKKKYKYPAELKKTFVITSKGKSYLVKWITGRLRFLYVFKPYVDVRARLEFYHTWDEMQGKIFTYINQAVDKALAKV